MTGSIPRSVTDSGISHGAPTSGAVPVHCGACSQRDADWPATSDRQVDSRSAPRGVRSPMPVMTTRRFECEDTSARKGIVTASKTARSRDRHQTQRHRPAGRQRYFRRCSSAVGPRRLRGAQEYWPEPMESASLQRVQVDSLRQKDTHRPMPEIRIESAVPVVFSCSAPVHCTNSTAETVANTPTVAKRAVDHSSPLPMTTMPDSVTVCP